MKLSILFPVYNEAATVREILDAVLAFSMEGIEKEVLIIEGNSTDGTKEIVAGYEGRPGVRVFYEKTPRGKGAAVRLGMREMTGDVLLIQDGDLEYKVSDYPKVLGPILSGEADIVFGSRARDPQTHWQYRQFRGLERLYGFWVNLGGVLFTGLFNALYGTRLTDGATMFKVYRKEVFDGFTLKSDGFDFDWEMQGWAAKRGRRFHEVSISYKARSRAEGKKIVFWRDGIRVLWAILKYRFVD